MMDNKENEHQMKRKLSRREKKEQKRLEKLGRTQSAGKMQKSHSKEYEDLISRQEDSHFTSIQAKNLYNQVPANNFTRTISNPEIVMKKRRERKLEQKLKEMGEGLFRKNCLQIFDKNASTFWHKFLHKKF